MDAMWYLLLLSPSTDTHMMHRPENEGSDYSKGGERGRKLNRGNLTDVLDP